MINIIYTFGLPGNMGINDPEIHDQIKKYYDYIRPSKLQEAWKRNFGNYDPLGVSFAPTKQDTCIEEARKGIQYAKENNCPVWLIFHGVDPEVKNAYSISSDNFRLITKLVYESGLEVTTAKSLFKGQQVNIPPSKNIYNVFSVTTNSTITELTLMSRYGIFNFTVQGPSGTKGYINVTVSKDLIRDVSRIETYVDNTKISHYLHQHTNSYEIIIIYTHSKHNVNIVFSVK